MNADERRCAMRLRIFSNTPFFIVTPAKAEVQGKRRVVTLDPRFRGGDREGEA